MRQILIIFLEFIILSFTYAGNIDDIKTPSHPVLKKFASTAAYLSEPTEGVYNKGVSHSYKITIRGPSKGNTKEIKEFYLRQLKEILHNIYPLIQEIF